MRDLLFAVVALILVAPGITAQDMRPNIGRSLFSDQKATRVGDAVTILIVETSSASNDAKTIAGRSDHVSLGAQLTTGSSSPGTDINGSLGTGSDFKGAGETSINGSVRGKLTAQVDSVLSNGNLVISGNRSITVNGEEHIIKVSGTVRPSDIGADNSIYSYNIVNAIIVVKGDGIVSEVQGPGLLTKFLHLLF